MRRAEAPMSAYRFSINVVVRHRSRCAEEISAGPGGAWAGATIGFGPPTVFVVGVARILAGVVGDIGLQEGLTLGDVPPFPPKQHKTRP